MKKFKKMGLILLTFTMIFVLAACGSDSGDTSGDSGSAAEGMTAAELLAVYEMHTGADAETPFIQMNYDQVVEAFGGEEPIKDEDDSEGPSMIYYYQASDTEGNVVFLFEDEDGVLECLSVSTTIPSE